MTQEWDFRERLQFSEGVKPGDALMNHLLAAIPSSLGAKRATSSEDRNGTDYWILRKSLPPISVDFKNRGFCPIERYGKDDACIEVTSIYTGDTAPPYLDEHRKKIGWTLDSSKKTDLVVYTWPAQEGLRFWILYFPFLCEAARRNWLAWKTRYGEYAALNVGYCTLSVYPPRKVIAGAIRELTVGSG